MTASAHAAEPVAGTPVRWKRVFAGLAALLAIAVLCGLGVWQLQRRVWKLDLIARVEHRLREAPVAAPGPPDWGRLSTADEYRPVRITGRFLNARETLVQAVTGQGGGYWVLTPLQTDGGFTVLVNRGFAPPAMRDPASRQAAPDAAESTVTGLLRVSEGHRGFLRSNDPAADRWYARDVSAIAAARGLGEVAPYFIDADAAPNPGGWPLGGLTVVQFANNHLIYALTWFALALMLAAGVCYAVAAERGFRVGRPRARVSERHEFLD